MATRVDQEEVSYAALGRIAKFEKQPDGTLTFEASKATGPDLDLDEQIIDPDFAKSAMDDWFKTGGNLREQHGSTAAGKATELLHRDDGAYISGRVVDPVSVTKVQLGVLQGLSVGIKGARVIKDAAAPNGRIVGGKIVEVSLVDRPCNPTCKLVVAKAAAAGGVEYVEEWSETPNTTKGAEMADNTDTLAAAIVKALDARDAAKNAAKADKKAAKKAAKAEKAEQSDIVKAEKKAAKKAAKIEAKAAKAAAFAELVKSAVADVTATSGGAEGTNSTALEELAQLKERVDKVEAMPAAGGPARGARPTVTIESQPDRTAADAYLAKAAAAEQAGDRTLAQGYRAKAAQLAG